MYIPITVRRLMEFLEEKGLPCSLTGSFVIGGYVKGVSDIDIVVDLSKPKPNILQSIYVKFGLDFCCLGSAPSDSNSESWKAETPDGYTINLIFTFTPELYTSWVTATSVSKGLCLHKKEYKVAMFEHYKQIANKTTKVEEDLLF